jgi:nucleoside-diphosphate-sugar epimerase
MLKLFRMIQRRQFIMLGKGDAFFHPAYIEDVARAFVLGAVHDRAAGQTFIIGGERYLLLRDLVAAIAHRLQVPSPGMRIPLWPVDYLARICEIVCAPLHLEPPLHRRRMSFFRNNRAFTIEKAKALLGYEPQVGLDEGLERTISWYEAHELLARRPAANGDLLRPSAVVAQTEAGPVSDTRQSSL